MSAAAPGVAAPAQVRAGRAAAGWEGGAGRRRPSRQDNRPPAGLPRPVKRSEAGVGGRAGPGGAQGQVAATGRALRAARGGPEPRGGRGGAREGREPAPALGPHGGSAPPTPPTRRPAARAGEPRSGSAKAGPSIVHWLCGAPTPPAAAGSQGTCHFPGAPGTRERDRGPDNPPQPCCGRARAGRARALVTRGVAEPAGVKCPPCGEGETGPLRRARWCPLGARVSSARPAGLPARATGTSSPRCPGGHSAPDPEAGKPGRWRGREGRGREEGRVRKTPWGRERPATRVGPPAAEAGSQGPGPSSLRPLSGPFRGRSPPASPGVERSPAPSCPVLPRRGGAPHCVSTPGVEAARPGARLRAPVARAPLPAPPARSRRPPRAELCDVRRPAGGVTRGADPARGGGRAGTRSMEPRVGCRLPVRVEQVVNGALLVTVSCGERSFAGILLDCTKK